MNENNTPFSKPKHLRGKDNIYHTPSLDYFKNRPLKIHQFPENINSESPLWTKDRPSNQDRNNNNPKTHFVYEEKRKGQNAQRNKHKKYLPQFDEDDYRDFSMDYFNTGHQKKPEPQYNDDIDYSNGINSNNFVDEDIQKVKQTIQLNENYQTGFVKSQNDKKSTYPYPIAMDEDIYKKAKYIVDNFKKFDETEIPSKYLPNFTVPPKYSQDNVASSVVKIDGNVKSNSFVNSWRPKYSDADTQNGYESLTRGSEYNDKGYSLGPNYSRKQSVDKFTIGGSKNLEDKSIVKNSGLTWKQKYSEAQTEKNFPTRDTQNLEVGGLNWRPKNSDTLTDHKSQAIKASYLEVKPVEKNGLSDWIPTSHQSYQNKQPR